MEREQPLRRFLGSHLPGRFHIGQGSIASTKRILPHQHDIIVADRDLSFTLLNTASSQLFPIESVHLIVEVRSRFSDLNDVAGSLAAVRSLKPIVGLRQLGNQGSETGSTAPPVQSIVVYQGPKQEATAIKHLNRINGADRTSGRRMAVDFILVLARNGDQSPSSGYLVGYSRTDKATSVEFAHHYYPQIDEDGLVGAKVVCAGKDSFAQWYAAILNHLGGVTVYPPNLYAYLGRKIGYVPWTRKPY